MIPVIVRDPNWLAQNSFRHRVDAVDATKIVGATKAPLRAYVTERLGKYETKLVELRQACISENPGAGDEGGAWIDEMVNRRIAWKRRDLVAAWTKAAKVRVAKMVRGKFEMVSVVVDVDVGAGESPCVRVVIRTRDALAFDTESFRLAVSEAAHGADEVAVVLP